jgi:hypothetical protein
VLDYSKGIYSKLRWGYVGKNDICFSIKIEDNQGRIIRSEKIEEIPEVEDLKQIFPI